MKFIKLDEWKWLIIVAILSSVLTGITVYYLKPSNYITEFPYINSELLKATPEEWVCDSMVHSRLNASKDSVFEKKDGIQGVVEKGTDKINLKIDGEILNVSSRAAFESGITESEPYEILRNDEKFLMAVNTNQEKTYIDTFVVEKSTGLSTWTKNRTYFFDPEGHPESWAFYFICR
ncbi:MAG: hypothetical protein UU56_C0014G0030 [Candidatus Curtissbacteria bacterium GW2011_GWA2_41_24]|uniref:Uncharacterized protein n=1 Tax=Candidatus Curtissbacteria bacterium GW2011_GWA2_41_24 TaxID=1618411 RepID=A0A0G0Y2Y9_9BACT|nr:MAG: hypothetical protein UU56_C0014G0030 [Candidatus Curtissbacteria bacterium GW2011_GWA2_41_24]